MKKVYWLMVLATLVVSAFAGIYENTDANGKVGATGHNPANVMTIKLTDTDTTDECDTLAATGTCSYIGPFMLTDNGGGNYNTLRLIAKGGVVASGDTVLVDYQLMANPVISDTNSSWTNIPDTIGSIGYQGSVVSITTPANAIMFRFRSLESTRVTIMNSIWALFGKNETIYKQR